MHIFQVCFIKLSSSFLSFLDSNMTKKIPAYHMFRLARIHVHIVESSELWKSVIDLLTFDEEVIQPKHVTGTRPFNLLAKMFYIEAAVIRFERKEILDHHVLCV
ncbi:hypothetical protein HELRODRAFT_159347 [Helobdella robusta]|uniref:Uncharacterized protein n=1 Tax=Helobdella robusta TaxID=6412 RepID=T1ENX2_HELRO|nr:hypothetical protein HELRODRAFT_159347 [Helobdella robusta]ESO12765.1 hypothetical protein HELRODRAFT_159347 [Helobdella robusta]